MGGLQPSCTNVEEINKIIDELLIGSFHSSIKEELDIESVEYEIIMDFIRNIDGFPEPSIKASAVPNEDKSQIEKVVFFSESISNEINSKFSRITVSSIFHEVIRVYIKFLLIHELVHVQQIKNGMTMEEYHRIEYKNNQFEKEANDKAVEFLSKDGVFQREVADIINSDKIVDYDIVTELTKLYIEEKE
ncbi:MULTISPECIES: hypothetical protein [unclassified Bacillus cereus group]|uniref:hypothetical protein n=1 Tax=unclassified Bacillus cereus group TaxID=2750818 RepID=UPI0022E60586|nr:MULTISPECIES: hypothetical protein [unclassified Bacillus cereus group]MDA2144876.1 hypothetical protein [Bacillus cereus group sp. Bc248]MDA2172933.1 hypothetical protein [Bacillus cereus group sp. Bc247]